MARRRLEQHHIRTLTKLGGAGSLGVSLPIELLRGLKWRRRQRLRVRRQGKRLIVEDYP